VKRVKLRRVWSLAFFLIGLLLYLIGFHNIDVSMNMLALSKQTGIEIIDISPLGLKQTYIQGYLRGVLFLIFGAIFMILGFVLKGEL